MRLPVLFCLFAAALAAPSGPMYKKKEDNVYRLELVPVSSTVIPLEDLEYTVGVGFDVHKGQKYADKYDGKPSDLITAAGDKKRPKTKAYVKQLTKADFDRF